MKRILTMAAMSLTAGVSLANVAWVLKSSQEENDLANAANWSETVDDGSVIEFTAPLTPGHSLWLSSDLTVGNILAKQTGEVVFDLGKNRTLSLKNSHFSLEGVETAVTLKSGTIKTLNGGVLIGYSGTKIRNSFIVDGSDARLVVRGSLVGVGTQQTDGYSSFILRNGATADFDGSFLVGSRSSNRTSSHNTGLITGAGT